ncbi:MAG: hypothetical protein P4L55_17565 [Syntrophobacteraceae bacterium]|nr:hypothetical protein [Syntrophobacteraceae bacterium]
MKAGDPEAHFDIAIWKTARVSCQRRVRPNPGGRVGDAPPLFLSPFIWFNLDFSTFPFLLQPPRVVDDVPASSSATVVMSGGIFLWPNIRIVKISPSLWIAPWNFQDRLTAGQNFAQPSRFHPLRGHGTGFSTSCTGPDPCGPSSGYRRVPVDGYIVSGNCVLDESMITGKSRPEIIWQSLFFAFFYNLLASPVAAAGMLNPLIAALAMFAGRCGDVCPHPPAQSRLIHRPNLVFRHENNKIRLHIIGYGSYEVAFKTRQTDGFHGLSPIPQRL